jgi:archaemetzincin
LVDLPAQQGFQDQNKKLNPKAQNESIVIAPIEKFADELLARIGSAVERIYGWKTQVRPLLRNVDFAYDARREQYHSTEILQKLAARAPGRTAKILALTKVDLFIPILTYVYGEAQLGGTACIISTHRLQIDEAAGNPGNGSLENRIIKEAIHELGHTFNLHHCPEHTCIMHYCRSVDDVDRKSNQLCRHCTVLLGDEMKRMRVAAYGNH